MRSRSAVSVLAGVGAVALIGTASAPPVIAEPTPTPTPSTTATDPPTDPPTTDPPTDPTDPPATDPPTTDPPTTDPPTDPTDPPTTDPPTDPTDPPTTDPPTDPPTTDPPTDPPADPTDPPADPGEPKTPVLSLRLSVSDTTLRPGGSITATVRVASANATAAHTVLRMSAPGVSVAPRTQRLGSVGGGGAAALATVRAPSDAEPRVFTLTAAVSATGAKGASRTYKLIITDAAGAPPPGVSLSNPPPGLPPLSPTGFNPLAGMKGPQVALPPVAGPRIAPASGPLVPVSNLRTLPGEPFTIEELGALQAGFLAALAAAVTLLLLRLRLIRRADARVERAARRRLQAAGQRLAGKRPTAARLRTLPPQPARGASIRLAWLPARQARAVRLSAPRP